jgi:DNA primase
VTTSQFHFNSIMFFHRGARRSTNEVPSTLKVDEREGAQATRAAQFAVGLRALCARAAVAIVHWRCFVGMRWARNK